MRYFIVFLILNFYSTLALGLNIEAERNYGSIKNNPDLQILSSTDIEVFDPVLKAFSKTSPNLNIRYVVASTKDIFETVKSESHNFDLIMSSAMDLQMKLANDGFAKSLPILKNMGSPVWSKWQDKLFGFSLEPIGIVVSSKYPLMSKIPTERRAFVSFLRANSDLLRGKVVTYDVTISGAGFLFATQDERQSHSFWRMAEVLGGVGTQVYCCSGDMLDAIENGKALIAYNIIGSYAEKRAKENNNFKIIYLQDYTHMLMRTALMPKSSENLEEVKNFLRFLLSDVGQNFIEHSTDMLSLKSEFLPNNRHFRPIRLDTGLLVYLDKLKKERFIEDWREAIIQ